MSEKRLAALAEEQRIQLTRMKELDANSKEEVESEADTELKLMLKAEDIVNQLKNVSCELSSLYADKDE